MSTEHTEWVEAVQPFAGATWSGILQVLSNSDKHRVGIEVSPTVIYELDADSVTADPENAAGLVTKIARVRVDFLLPALTPAGDVSKVFDDIVVGAGHLVNRFLVEAGIVPIRIEKREASA
jgi:hypothetical protein